MINGDAKKLIWAVACILNGRAVSRDEMGEAAFSLGLSCGIGGIVSPQIRLRNVRKNMLFAAERAELYGFLDELGCWYMPMKGLVIDSYYPAAGMRMMSDNDILFDAAYRDEVREWFLQRGYETDWANGVGVHDTYYKDPLYNFEMHVQFFDSGHAVFAEYYANIADILLEAGEFGKAGEFDEDAESEGAGRMERRMSPEDFYLYMLAHSYKHYSSGGDGLRMLTDVHVLLKACGETMDWDHISRGLVKLGLSDYEEHVHRLAENCFCSPGTDAPEFHDNLTIEKEDLEMLEFILKSGVRGREDRRINVGVRKLGKLRYLKERFWPPAEFFINENSDCRDRSWKVNYYRVKRLKDRFGKTDIRKEIATVIRTKGKDDSDTKK